MNTSTHYALLMCTATLLAACNPNAPRPRTVSLDAPVTESGRGPYFPSQARVSGHSVGLGEHLADVDTCDNCHDDVVAQQQLSAHANASFNNPIYRFGLDAFRRSVSKQASQMCGGCHDVALLVDGAMNTNVAPDDERAHAGVSCRVCHGIESATYDGNGSYSLSPRAIPIPDGRVPASVATHRQAAKPIAHDKLCGSCHRSFLSPDTGNQRFLTGMDDLAAWKTSAYNGDHSARVDPGVSTRSCVDCHMPMVKATLGDRATDRNGNIRSHRFLGGHTWLAQMQGDRDQLARQRQFLRGVVTVDIAAAKTQSGPWTRPADGAPVAPGDSLTLDIVVRNTNVGHSFPAGVKDAVDSWLEVEVTDARGRAIARSGDDDQAHRFRAIVSDDAGVPQLARTTNHFAQVIADHTVPARDARVIRYALTIPSNLAASQFPLRVDAKVLHRSRNLTLQRKVCAASHSARARAFNLGRVGRAKTRLDPCKPQPVTIIAQTNTWIGPGANRRMRSATPRAPWSRLYELGLGLLAELPSHAAEARDTLHAARRAARAAPPHARAQIYAALATLHTAAPCGPSAGPGWPTCQGRLAAGLKWVREAEAIVPGHPALARIRAQLLAASGRWRAAAAWWRQLAGDLPSNTPIVSSLVSTLTALGSYGTALSFAERSLRLTPRDPRLLRGRAIALQALGRPAALVQRAKQRAASHASIKRPGTIRARCAQRDRHCARELYRVHTHQLRPITPHTRQRN